MQFPVTESQRIEVLDVVRGFSLLGILLLNIIAFGLVSQSYINPSLDLPGSFTIDWVIWGAIEVTAEGAMRGIFSVLFGGHPKQPHLVQNQAFKTTKPQYEPKFGETPTAETERGMFTKLILWTP